MVIVCYKSRHSYTLYYLLIIFKLIEYIIFFIFSTLLAILFVNIKSSIQKEPFLEKKEKTLLLFFLAIATLKPYKIKGL